MHTRTSLAVHQIFDFIDRALPDTQLPTDIAHLRDRHRDADRIPMHFVYELWEFVAHHLPAPMAASAVAWNARRDSRNILRLLAGANHSLSNALSVAIQGWPLVTDAYSLMHLDHGFGFSFSTTAERLGARLDLIYSLSALVGYAERWTQARIRPTRIELVDLEWPERWRDGMRCFFGTRVVLGAARDAVRYHPADAEARLLTADPGLRSILAPEVSMQLRDLARAASVVHRLWRIFEQVVTAGRPQSAAAKRLGMSERSLRRQLAAENSSFTQLMDRWRQEQAGTLLYAMSDDQLAMRLGFRDTNAFRRAFRRWNGKSPYRLRSERS